MKNKKTPKILLPYEWLDKEYPMTARFTKSDIQEYAEYYHKSMLQQFIPVEKEIEELVIKKYPSIYYTSKEQYIYKQVFKTAINHLTKTNL